MSSSRRKYRLLSAIHFFFIFPVSFVCAQIPITYLGINQGLSNNSARTILQDHKGFIWIGTFDGLNRYDGYNFQVYRHKVNDTNSLLHPAIYALEEDQSGNIWAGTRKGTSIYNRLTGKFSNLRIKGIPGVMSDVVRAMGTDKRNNIFVGTENLGLLFCQNANTLAQKVELNAGGKRTSSYCVQAIRTGQDGRVWVFVQNRGLCLFDYASATIRELGTDVKMATCLEIVDGNVWIGTTQGLYQYDVTTGACKKVFDIKDGLLKSNCIIGLTLDRDGKLWIGTNAGGVNIWDRATRKMEYIGTGDSKYALSAVNVYTILEDKDGRKWIGTQKGGICIVDPHKSRFRVIAHEKGNDHGFKGNFVTSFYESPDSTLWIGTEDAGINIWDRKANTFRNLSYGSGNLNAFPTNSITSFAGNSKGDVWVASFNSGIARLSGDGHVIKRYQCINPVSGLNDQVVFVLYKDHSNTVWAAALRQGNRYAALYYYNRSGDRFESFDTRLSDLFVLTEDREGGFWGGSLNQLVKIDRVNKKHSFFDIGQAVRAICEDRAGNFWIGTEGGGLVLFDRTRQRIVSRYTTENGLCNNSVLSIHEDQLGHLWMSTSNGLSRLDPGSKTFVSYFYNDGLQSNQFNYSASLLLRSGELVLGGISGFNIFRPEKITPVNDAPPVILTTIKVNDTLIDASSPYVIKTIGTDEIRKLKMPFNEAVLSFEFAALEYTAPEKISYAYYLEGWDHNWNNIGNLRTANYTHLSEGTYTFHVKSTNSEGHWNKAEIFIRIVVLPPRYRSWWAYLTYISVIGALLYIFWLYRIRQTRLKYEIAIARVNIEKERVEKEKQQAEYEKEKAVLEAERVINEKDKELSRKQLEFFTNVAHEFRSPLTLIINPVKDLLQKNTTGNGDTNSGELPIIYRNARRMLSLVDQLLLFRKADTGTDKVKPAKLNFYLLCHEVYLCFVQQAKVRNIKYEFMCDDPNLMMYVDREKMEIILFNLLSNAIKFTPDGGCIAFNIREDAAHVEVLVLDNGSGIPEQVGNRLFDKFYKAEGAGGQAKPGFGIGLYLVKQFAEMHKGDISYSSTPGKGTVFCLKLKKGKDHFDANVIAGEEVALPVFLDELMGGEELPADGKTTPGRTEVLAPIIAAGQIMLVVDDDADIRKYIGDIFMDTFTVYEADSGKKGMEMAEKFVPDIIISDIKMDGGDGIDLCKEIKNHSTLGYIPVILLTGSQNPDLKLEGVEGGADDYITKPFDKELLLARVSNLQKNKSNLRKFFFNEITLNKQDQKISKEYKEFLERCIAIVEAHLDDDEFSIMQLSAEMGRSYSSVYKKIRLISGQSLKGFVRFIRLRKAAELFINTNHNVSEIAFRVGIYDAKFFREQFNKVFGMNPSEYIKKYRKPFQDQYSINSDNSE